jgi:type VI secretion system protein ImpJ
MASSEQIHWSEGLYLHPHHLQVMQRQLLDRVGLEHRLTWSYPYGLIESELSIDDLENHRIRFERLRLVMPSGLYVSVPDNADLPALDVKAAFQAASEAVDVYLCVPTWQSVRPNAIDPQSPDGESARRIFKIVERELNDENIGQNPQRLPMRRLNARLLLEDQDRTDMEALKVVRITRQTRDDGTTRPKRDERFFPVCMTLAGSPPLYRVAMELANAVEAARKELVTFMKGRFNVEQMGGRQFEQLTRLQMLNRYAAVLRPLILSPNVPPFAIYLQLRQLLGDLASLNPDSDLFDAPEYDHDQPALVFLELDRRIRPLLGGVVKAKYRKVNFEKRGQCVAAAMAAEDFTEPTGYYLAIRTRLDRDAVRQLVEDMAKFKLMNVRMVDKPGVLALRGMPLKAEWPPPPELPVASGVPVYYFRLAPSGNERVWDDIKKEKEVGARWPDVAVSDFEVTLYMILP